VEVAAGDAVGPAGVGADGLAVAGPGPPQAARSATAATVEAPLSHRITGEYGTRLGLVQDVLSPRLTRSAHDS
jgi:hypothetical protein